MVSVTVRLAVVIALVLQTGFVIAADADAPAVSNPENWENVSAAFTQQIGADDVEPVYMRHCIGLMVAPTGDLIMQTCKGVSISKDAGATWSMSPDIKVMGRCGAPSMAYPYDGRMAFFLVDNPTDTGGITLDGGKTWKTFQPITELPGNARKTQRGFEFADIDWNTPDPQTIYGLTHEPYFTVFSKDGGQSWQMPYEGKEESGKGDERLLCMGVIDAHTLTRYRPTPPTPPTAASQSPGGVIELSTDAGQTWTQVATNYQILGRRPVHYGKNVYWTTAQGVIVTSDGKNWTLTGAGAEGAIFGPYFGSSEKEFVVVSGENFLKTQDGGKTWKPIARFYKPSEVFRHLTKICYFGWDSTHNILYSSGEGAPVYRLKL
jgi:hypothetical protein